MKQLSIRLLAPFHTSATLANRVVSFSTRKANLVLTMPQRLLGQWRLYQNYCPECNSTKPTTHCCDVCNSDTRAFFHWTEDTRNEWWKKYAEKHHIAL